MNGNSDSIVLMQTNIRVGNARVASLGQVTMAGAQKSSRWLGSRSMRVLGSYALVYLLSGSGRYRDANGMVRKVEAGDAILLFPELAHRYGPGPGETWNEFYLVFNGPLFDLCRSLKLIDSSNPVVHCPDALRWWAAYQEFATHPLPQNTVEVTAEAVRCFDLLMAMTGLAAATDGRRSAAVASQLGAVNALQPPWLQRALRMLEANLQHPLSSVEVARAIDLPHETFRKRFAQEMGMAPGQYRKTRQMDAARALLRQTTLTNKEIAASLGFLDPFHFSRRFKHYVGQSPRAYRLAGEPAARARPASG